MEYTDEYVKELFKSSKNQSDVIKKLGLKNTGSAWRLINKLAKQIDLNLKEYGKNATYSTKEKYAKNPKHCKYCGKELTYEQRKNECCSHSCSAKISNLKRNHNSKETNKNCLYCGKELSNKQKYNKFCSHHCSVEYKYNKLIERWLNGENFVKGGHQVPTYIKRYLMEMHNNKCEKCGWGEEHPITHNIPLKVHHIDGDCTNNKLENLQLLCPNCHCLTENFGSLNKESKRFHRKKIIKDYGIK